MKIVTVEQMQALESQTEARGISTNALMENAGMAVAEKARDLIGRSLRGEHVTVLVGPGNNGGDGLVAARHLNDWGARVHVCLCAPRKEGDPKLEALRDYVVDVIELLDGGDTTPLARALNGSHLAIDAVLGTGMSRAIVGSMRTALELLQHTKKSRTGLQVLALDVPSGLDADAGTCEAATPSADVTVTLGYPKVGLFSFPGAAKVGKLEIVDIGIPLDLAAGVDLELSQAAWVGSILPRRPLNANKGTFGRVMVVAGSANYVGAAYLACAGAIKAGAGLVTLATPRSLVPVVASMLPEVTYIPLQESEWGVVKGADSAREIHQALPSYETLLVGCGLGQRPPVMEMVRHLLLSLPANLAPRMAVDADGLNILSRVPEWWQQIKADTVLTPHPGELRRLTEQTTDEIEADRLKAARQASAGWRKTVLLKGAHSIIASPDGRARINPFVNPGLATAGTGDVLAGLIAGFLAQGLSTFHAAAAGAYVHGAAAEQVSAEIGDTGMAASDLLPAIPRAIRSLRG